MSIETISLLVIGIVSGYRMLILFVRDRRITEKTFFIWLAMLGSGVIFLSSGDFSSISVLIFVLFLVACARLFAALTEARRRLRLPDRILLLTSELLASIRSGVGLRESLRRYSESKNVDFDVKNLISSIETERKLPSWLSGTIHGLVIHRILAMDSGSTRVVDRISALRTGLKLSLRLRRKVSAALSPAKVQAALIFILYFVLNIYQLSMQKNFLSNSLVWIGHALFFSGVLLQIYMIRRFEWSICRGPLKS